MRKDWINGGGTAGDWPFGGPVLDEKEAGSLMASLRRLFRSLLC